MVSVSEMSSSNQPENPKTSDIGSSVNGAGSEGLEDLLRKLHGQIKSSDWLVKNTTSNLEKENPELVRAWKEATQPDTSSSQNN